MSLKMCRSHMDAGIGMDSIRRWLFPCIYNGGIANMHFSSTIHAPDI